MLVLVFVNVNSGSVHRTSSSKERTNAAAPVDSCPVAWRPMRDLLSPYGQSVNQSINRLDPPKIGKTFYFALLRPTEGDRPIEPVLSRRLMQVRIDRPRSTNGSTALAQRLRRAEDDAPLAAVCLIGLGMPQRISRPPQCFLCIERVDTVCVWLCSLRNRIGIGWLVDHGIRPTRRRRCVQAGASRTSLDFLC